MRVSEVSKRYAKALLAVSKQKDIHNKIFTELKVVAEIFSADAGIKEYFENPMISPDQKVAVIKTSLTGRGISEELINALQLLADKNRLGIFDQVVLAYQNLLDIEQGVTRGVVRSARELTSDTKNQIEQKIAKVLNKKIVLTYAQDTNLLGGIVAEVGGWTFDDSVETHLKKLNEELNRRAN